MPRRPARLIWLLAAASSCAALGAAATAQPGGAPRELTPTAELASDGTAEAPGTSGGVPAPAAPVAEAVEGPETEPVPGSEPVHEPGLEPEVAPAPGAAPAPEVAAPLDEAEPDPSADAPAAVIVPSDPPPSPPTSEQALEAEGEALVPVVVLSSPVAAAEDTDPLIDIAPKRISAPPLAEVSQTDDDEVIIEVPVDEDEGEEPAVDQDPSPAPVVPRGRQLPLTGRELLPALAAALMLIGFGMALRISTAPTASSRARA